tara:strand:+ start:8125 stop:8817 length:693 start_codon:yes stop_codon:yes gene_type:complete
MEKNKTGKYLKYAVGEIILVIIGILIAVSINNWNGDRKLKLEQQSIFKDLKQEVEENYKALAIAFEGNEKSFQAGKEMKALLYDSEAFNKMSDSIFDALVVKMNMNYTYDPQYGILNSIISSGQINQFSNKELKYLLASIKELTIDALEDALKIESQRDELMRSSYNHAYLIKDNIITGYNIKLLYSHPDFRWAVHHLFYSVRRDGLEEEKELMTTLEHIIELIDQNIDK